MKFMGDTDKIVLNAAKILSEQGIDIFNPEDDFFNHICYPYNNPNKKDIIINDRRNDIFQNITFCQTGCCRYVGINLSLFPTIILLKFFLGKLIRFNKNHYYTKKFW